MDFLKNFCSRVLISNLRRLDCAALIGPNGAGKSTFLKTILGSLSPLAGEATLGASLHVGYFAQAHEGLDPEKTVLDEIMNASGMLPYQARDYLGKYLFSGDDAFKLVSMLSGGERGRLALAKLALEDTNLLLLDEPTNHLDIPSQEVLQAVLDNYQGTILLVSHDRYLVDALATQIWEIDPDESQMTAFNGTYSQMKEEREKEAARLAEQQTSSSKATSNAKRSTSNAKTKEERRKIADLQRVGEQHRGTRSETGESEFPIGESTCKARGSPQDRHGIRTRAKRDGCKVERVGKVTSGMIVNFKSAHLVYN